MYWGTWTLFIPVRTEKTSKTVPWKISVKKGTNRICESSYTKLNRDNT